MEQSETDAPAGTAPGRLDPERLEELRELDGPGDGTSYVDRAIAHFLDAVDEQVAAMQAAAADGDTARLQAVAHKVAGAALNLGATELGEGLRTVEEHLMDGALDDATALLARIVEQLPADLDALRAFQRDAFPATAR